MTRPEAVTLPEIRISRDTPTIPAPRLSEPLTHEQWIEMQRVFCDLAEHERALLLDVAATLRTKPLPAGKHVAWSAIVVVDREREALRKSELTSEMRSRREGAALVELSKVEGDLNRAERKLEEVVSTSAPGVGGAPLAATAAALELVAECWNGLNEGIGVTFDGLLRDRARELREGK